MPKYVKYFLVFVAVAVFLILGIAAANGFRNSWDSFRYVAKTTLRVWHIKSVVKKFNKADGPCLAFNVRSECAELLINEIGHFQTVTDVPLTMVGVVGVCARKPIEPQPSKDCLHRSSLVILEKINLNEIVIAKGNHRGSQELLHRMDLELLNTFLRKFREKYVQQYAKSQDDGERKTILNIISMIDLKLVELAKL